MTVLSHATSVRLSYLKLTRSLLAQVNATPATAVRSRFASSPRDFAPVVGSYTGIISNAWSSASAISVILMHTALRRVGLKMELDLFLNYPPLSRYSTMPGTNNTRRVFIRKNQTDLLESGLLPHKPSLPLVPGRWNQETGRRHMCH